MQFKKVACKQSLSPWHQMRSSVQWARCCHGARLWILLLEGRKRKEKRERERAHMHQGWPTLDYGVLVHMATCIKLPRLCKYVEKCYASSRYRTRTTALPTTKANPQVVTQLVIHLPACHSCSTTVLALRRTLHLQACACASSRKRKFVYGYVF